MNLELPASIAGFFHATNSGDTRQLLVHFTPDAVVADEGREHRGAEIQAWLDGAIAKYQPLQAEIVELASSESQSVVSARVSGSFPGSPVVLRYHFTLRAGLIAALSITA